MKGMRPEQVINGTHGELWIDGEYMAEIIAVEAKVSIEKAEVIQVGRLTKGYKVVGLDGKGSLKLHKVNSYFIRKMSDNIKKGKQTICTIISKLNDPDSLGCERVAIKDAVFDELTLVNWEAKKNGEESVAFTFTDWDLIDLI